MIDLNDLLEQVWPIAAQQATPTEYVSLNIALNRVLAQDILSSLNVPQHDNSGMDGYAVRRADIQPSSCYQVSQRVPAGASPQPLQPGTVARIFTGAPIPPGADSVVMQEDVVVNDEASVTFNATPRLGQWVRRTGEDIATGQVVLAKGTRLDAIHVGLLASIGVSTVLVSKRLKVGVMVTGSELQSPGQVLQPGQIYNSNEYVWCGLLESMNVEVRSVGIVPDNLEATCTAFQSLADCDAVISSGGVSVGEEDHVKPAIEKVGQLRSWKVAMKPGKPIAFGHINRPGGGQSWFFGLPGNPVSSAVAFQLIVKPFLGLLEGQTREKVDWRSRTRKVQAEFAWPTPDSRREEFLRADVQSDKAKLFENQSSGVLTSLARSTGLIRLAKGQRVNPGDWVDYVAYQDLMR
ncbi:MULTISPECIES: gephyrin-like molybdotransferase Glp [unclassified Limnobacter]|uniref:molybdopterin molybdotransferase MoeA n=1 Tax=unclassified Limnobacter TaxID=2630203 RepID=UPI000C3A8058|nr:MULTISPECIES: gephyrin-like molybdotransferase Glp [unclassified Limnobacter]MAZ09256.1 molybdopterin molybdenumtransferase MoeA [Sutterellaceae bacterium]|tara:strand:- start:194 stop:1414 length:1221 start_codon:yes stop_codon:yes gene_type:complete